jgi:hypothetical protein
MTFCGVNHAGCTDSPGPLLRWHQITRRDGVENKSGLVTGVQMPDLVAFKMALNQATMAFPARARNGHHLRHKLNLFSRDGMCNWVYCARIIAGKSNF